MDLFKVSNGPWEKLFNGTFQGHEIELYANPEKILMILIFEKKLDRVEGAIVELYKVFSATGEIESFVETLPRDVLIVTKHDEKSTLKFLLLGSKPAYARWTEQDFLKETDSLVKRLSTSSIMIKDVSKAYEVNIQEIAESSEEVKSAFFTQPMLVPLLATSSHSMQGETPIEKVLGGGEIILGITRDQKRVTEPLSIFAGAIVSEGSKEERARVLQVIGESALLSNVPGIFIDKENTFINIGVANNNSSEIQKYMVELDSIGFPVKNYMPVEGIRIDLNLINPNGIAELFGIGDKDFARILKIGLSKGEVDSIDELVEKITKLPANEEFSEFEIQRTARIVKLFSIIYPGLFGGKNETPEMLKKGNSNIARASVLELNSLDERSTILIVHSILRGILADTSKKESKSRNAMIVIPKAEIFQPGETPGIVSKEIYSTLNELKAKNVNFILGAEKLIDVEKETRNKAEAKINIVSGNDIGVQIKNRKSYRVLVRPTLSKPK